MKDTSKGYSTLSIVLHWLAAITVIALFVLGEMAEDAIPDDRKFLLGLHISIAISMFIVLWARIIWRVINIRPTAPTQHIILMKLAHWVPTLLLIGIAAMLISGPLMVWSKGYSIHIFSLVTIPSPLGEMEAFHEVMKTVHNGAAKLIFFAFVLHIAGILKHLIIDRDSTLLRMLKPGNKP